MEALWNLEDKWKLTTKQALVVFSFSAIAVIGLCVAATTLFKSKKLKPSAASESNVNNNCSEWLRVKSCWSEAKKWEEEEEEESVGRSCRFVAASEVWQRPILMGEKCEFPMFSGLILYDETGLPLHQSLWSASPSKEEDQGKQADVLKTTLKDLL